MAQGPQTMAVPTTGSRENRAVLVEPVHGDAEVAALGNAGLDERDRHRARQVDRNRKADAGARFRAADGGVDTDHLPVEVDQRTAAVARIDGGIGLDEILVIGQSHLGALFRADNALGHGLFQSTGISDGDHGFPHFDRVRIAQFGQGQVLGVDLQHRQVRRRIGADQFCLVFLAILQLDDDPVRIFDNVVVGEDVPP